jgi:hypothetical protein
MPLAAPPRVRRGWPRLARLAAALSVGAAFATGCGSNGDEGPSGPIDGTYALVEFQGRAVPFTVTTPQGTIAVRGGELLLDDGDYEATFDIEIDGAPTSELDETGTYERNGSRVRFSPAVSTGLLGTEVDATLSNNGRTIALATTGISARFER